MERTLATKPSYIGAEKINEGNFESPMDQIGEINTKITATINNFKQRGGDFKKYVKDLQKAANILKGLK